MPNPLDGAISHARRPLHPPLQRTLLTAVAVLATTFSFLWAASLPSAAATSTLWSSSAAPATASVSDTKAVEVGTRFASSQAGTVTAIRFYKGPDNDGTHTGRLWSGDGKVLAAVTFTGETATGWQQARLATPVSIKADTSYVVSYTAPSGGYAAQAGVFSNGSTVTRGPLTAVAGVYSYSLGFPTASFRGTSYFVDVVTETAGSTTDEPTSPPTSTPPPAGGGTGGFADADSTGVSGSLRSMSGPVTLSSPGQVLEDVAITGRVTVKADNVTLRNVQITSDDVWALLNYGKNLTVEDSTVIGTRQTQASIADADGGSSVLRRVEVSGAPDGVLLGTGSQLRDSLIHDLASFDGAHNDAVVVTSSTGVRITGNTILNDNDQTSVIFLSEFASGTDVDVDVDHNLLAGGGYTVYGGAPARGLSVTNNQFSTRYFPRGGYRGPVAYWSGTGNTWSGNTWADGPKAGQTVNG